MLVSRAAPPASDGIEAAVSGRGRCQAGDRPDSGRSAAGERWETTSPGAEWAEQ